MTLTKKIIHIDMDCFFAAVEMRDCPEYQGIPLAVGGSLKQRGVISTCNYEARAFGIHSAMSTAQAFKRCPSLTLVPGRMDVYKKISSQIRAIMREYTPIIEPISLDEAYLDVTDSPFCKGSATLIAEEIRYRIFNELGLTASAGVAPIKFLAKVSSDMNKPNGQYVITPMDMQSFIDNLPLEKIPGVGKVSIEHLHQHGFYIGSDIRHGDYHYLLKNFGRLGSSLWKKCQGQDDRDIEVSRERRSLGVEKTMEENIVTYEQCWNVIQNELYFELRRRLKKNHKYRKIAKLGMKIKFHDFQTTTIEHQYKKLDISIYSELLHQILERQKNREIRLIGINIMFTSLDEDRQLSFSEFDRYE